LLTVFFPTAPSNATGITTPFTFRGKEGGKGTALGFRGTSFGFSGFGVGEVGATFALGFGFAFGAGSTVGTPRG